MRNRLWMALPVFAWSVGCGGTHPKPGVVLQGQLLASGAVSLQAPVSLAMAWYPSWATGSPSAPAKAITTQALTFQGQFPVDFTFDLPATPPDSALTQMSAPTGAPGFGSGVGRIAYGMLIAYEDLNRNGQLDSIPSGGSPIDNIVGVSGIDPSMPPPVRSYFVIYLDGTIGQGDYFDFFSLQQGYNLLAVHNDYGVERVDLAKGLSVQVTRNASLNVFACPDFAGSAYAWGQTACGIDPEGGKALLEGALASTAQYQSSFFVYDATGSVTNAQISVDGTAVPFQSDAQQYYAQPVAPGLHQISVVAPGHSSETIAATVPDQVQITAPTAGQTLHTGGPVTLSWASAANTLEYDVAFESENADGTSGPVLSHVLTTATSVTTAPITFNGTGWVSVKALGTMAVGTQGSFVTPLSSQRIQVTLGP